jgi:hypothetical protein
MLLGGCEESCNGNIETIVLFAKPGANGGRKIYVNVVNKPGLGIQKTLLYEGKDFGTFPHVLIIQDPASKFASNSRICFTAYQQGSTETGGDLTEEGIPRIRLY